MKTAKDFYTRIKLMKDVRLTQALTIDLFAFYLQEVAGQEFYTSPDIAKIFEECDLHVPARLSTHLGERSSGRRAIYLKKKAGYRLSHAAQADLSALLGEEHPEMDIAPQLEAIKQKLPDGDEKTYLSEAVNCFGVNAYRATIIMVWNLTVSHLYEYILAHQLAAFNAELAKNTDKRVKVTNVSKKDDFNEIPEGIFVALCRRAFISNDVRKILEEKLGVRNSAAHPSGIKFSRAKVIGFVEDLVDNVILKYQI